jgi:hypothetical protein
MRYYDEHTDVINKEINNAEASYQQSGVSLQFWDLHKVALGYHLIK